LHSWCLVVFRCTLDGSQADRGLEVPAWMFDRTACPDPGANPIEIDPLAIDRFARLMREQLLSGDVAARKAYLSSVVDAIIVSEDKIRIIGSNDNIRSTFGPKGQPMPRVRKSVQEWCATRDKIANSYICMKLHYNFW
jgi:hypothetical protein